MKSLATRAAAFGVESGTVATEMRAVQVRKRRMVADLIEEHEKRYATSGAELIRGEARFVGVRTVVHRGGTHARTIAGERVFLNVGTRASMPGIPG